MTIKGRTYFQIKLYRNYKILQSTEEELQYYYSLVGFRWYWSDSRAFVPHKADQYWIVSVFVLLRQFRNTNIITHMRVCGIIVLLHWVFAKKVFLMIMFCLTKHFVILKWNNIYFKMYNSYFNPILLHHVELWSYGHKIIEYYVRTSTIKSSNQNTKMLYCNVLIGRFFYFENSRVRDPKLYNSNFVSPCIRHFERKINY